MLQKTIKKNIEVNGFGLHNGEYVTMKLNPAKLDSGIYFIRKDLNPNKLIEASIENVSKTYRSTNLKKQNSKNISPRE